MQENSLMNDPENLARISWACRRGMLELDVLLVNFLKSAYQALSHEEKLVFIQLLECQDPVLFAYLMGHEEPTDKALAAMAKRIRDHARSSR